ncbi:MAG: glycosyltransferase family 2 protein [Chloroflexota bacterium]
MHSQINSSIAQSNRKPTSSSCSIVIVSWNTRDLLAQCLHSLPDQNIGETWRHHSYEVIVVDNASTDGSVELVREEFPWVRLIANHDNAGFARANNQAIRTTDAQYVLLLNPDTIVHRGALEALIDCMDRTLDAGAVGANLRNPDGSSQASCFPEPTLRREAWRLFHLDAIHPYAEYPTDQWGGPRPYPVDVVQGTCMLLRRSALSDVGLLDEDYFIYSEEVDLCYRLRQRGWGVYWVPDATIVHYGGQSTRQQAEAMFLRLYDGKVRYFRKHGALGSVMIYKFILFAASITRLMISPLALLLERERRLEQARLAKNYWRLIRSIRAL